MTHLLMVGVSNNASISLSLSACKGGVDNFLILLNDVENCARYEVRISYRMNLLDLDVSKQKFMRKSEINAGLKN